MLLSALFFLVLLYTRSRSGLLAFAVADVIFWAGIYISKAATKTTHFALIAIHSLFAFIVFFNGTYIAQIDKYITLDGWKQFANKVTTQQSNKVTTPEQSDKTTSYTAPALESGGTESTVIRKYVWEGAINAWKSSTKTKLIGTGTETFAFAFYQFRPVEHNMTSEWDFLYNKAHNEYLNFLATSGAIGLGSYLLLIGVSIVWFIRRGVLPHLSAHTNTVEHNDFLISLALFAGWISLLVTNFFGFSVVVTQLFLFLFPAILYLLTSGNAIQYIRLEFPDAPAFLTFLPVTVQTRFLRIMQIVILCIGIATVFRISTMWYADKQFAQGYQYDRAGMYAQSIPALLSAISLNPQEPLYHDELAGAYSTLAAAAYSAHEATQTANLADLALSESNIATTISPKNVNFLKTRTKVYYSLSTITPSLNASAISTLEQALALSPNDPKIYYNLAILSGRNGDNNKAIAYLLKAKALKRDYRDVYNALNIFYADAGKKAEAQAILEEYLTQINPNDKDFRSRITP
jgi:tetratricopeptide (TPR) repeat protein